MPFHHDDNQHHLFSLHLFRSWPYGESASPQACFPSHGRNTGSLRRRTGQRAPSLVWLDLCAVHMSAARSVSLRWLVHGVTASRQVQLDMDVIFMSTDNAVVRSCIVASCRARCKCGGRAELFVQGRQMPVLSLRKTARRSWFSALLQQGGRWQTPVRHDSHAMPSGVRRVFVTVHGTVCRDKAEAVGQDGMFVASSACIYIGDA